MNDNPLFHLSAYDLGHLPSHLEAASNISDLHRLLALETPSNRNAWFEAKDSIGKFDEYLADVIQAWKLSEVGAQYDNSTETSSQVALQLRYAFISASVRNIAMKIPPLLLKALVQHKLWSAPKALRYSLVIKESKRGKAIAELMPVLSPSLRQQAFEAVWIVDNEVYKVQILTELIPNLTRGQLQKIVKWVVSLSTNWNSGENQMAQLVASLSLSLSHELLQQTLEWVVKLRYENERVKVLVELIPSLPPTSLQWLLDYLLKELFYNHWNDSALVVVTETLIPILPDYLLRRAFFIIDKIFYTPSKVQVLSLLILKLPEELLREIMEIIKEWDSQGNHTDAISVTKSKLLIRLSELNHHEEALREAKKIQDKDLRFKALVEIALIPFKFNFEEEALSINKEINNSIFKSKVLIEKAPILPERLLKQALAIARNISTQREKARVLVALASRLPREEAGQILDEALEAAKTTNFIYDDKNRLMTQGYVRVVARTELAPQLAKFGFPDKALKEIEEIVSLTVDHKEIEEAHKLNAEALSKLGPYLPKNMLYKALEIKDKVVTDEARGFALKGLAPYLPEPLLKKTLLDSKSKEEIAALAPYLPEYLLRHTLEEIIDEFIYDVRSELVGILSPYLSKSLLKRAVVKTSELRTKYGEAPALSGLGNHIREPWKGEVLAKAFETVMAISDERSRSSILQKLSRHLNKSLLEQAILNAKTMSFWHNKNPTLVDLLIRLGEQGYVEEAFIEAQNLDRYYQAKVIVGMAPFLSPSLQKEALEIVEVSDDVVKEMVLKGLAAYLLKELMPKALLISDSISKLHLRVEVIAALVPYLPLSCVEHLHKEVQHIKLEYLKVQVIAGLIPRIAKKYRKEIITLAFTELKVSPKGNLTDNIEEYQSDKDLSDAVVAIAPYLSQSQLKQLLENFNNIFLSGTSEKGEIIKAVAPYLSEKLLREAISICQDFERYERSKAHEGLLPRLAALGYPGEALEEVQYLSYEWNKVYALQGILPHLTEPFFRQVLKQVMSIDMEEVKAKALTDAIPYLSNSFLKDASIAVQQINNKFHREEPLRMLAQHLIKLPTDELITIWNQILNFLAARDRLDIFYDIYALAPVVASLGEEQGVIESVNAVQDTVRWWP